MGKYSTFILNDTSVSNVSPFVLLHTWSNCKVSFLLVLWYLEYAKQHSKPALHTLTNLQFSVGDEILTKQVRVFIFKTKTAFKTYGWISKEVRICS